jgi:hypothetical protein
MQSFADDRCQYAEVRSEYGDGRQSKVGIVAVIAIVQSAGLSWSHDTYYVDREVGSSSKRANGNSSLTESDCVPPLFCIAPSSSCRHARYPTEAGLAGPVFLFASQMMRGGGLGSEWSKCSEKETNRRVVPDRALIPDRQVWAARTEPNVTKWVQTFHVGGSPAARSAQKKSPTRPTRRSRAIFSFGPKGWPPKPCRIRTMARAQFFCASRETARSGSSSRSSSRSKILPSDRLRRRGRP